MTPAFKTPARRHKRMPKKTQVEQIILAAQLANFRRAPPAAG